MIEGFLEGVDAYQARGWVYDTASPDRAFLTEIWKQDVMIGRATASLFRADLAQAGIGDGRHAFIYNMDRPLTEADRATIVVRALTDQGPVALGRLATKLDQPATEVKVLDFDGLAVDPSQTPVFVLGAARSGTSAMAQALLKVGYEGHQEGHLLDLLASLAVTLDNFLNLNADDLQGGRDTMLARFSPDYLSQSLDELFIKAARCAYPSGLWLDKTPNSNMVHLAPRLKRMWPKASFIFMKRRFLENSASRSRKFPGYDFARNCREWRNTMQAWLDVRASLEGSAIEVDQWDLMQHPCSVSSQVAEVLRWDDARLAVFRQALTYDWPERTSPCMQASLTLGSMGWNAAQIELYQETCSLLMREFGYSESNSYYLDGEISFKTDLNSK